jgi:hypothetical protein
VCAGDGTTTIEATLDILNQAVDGCIDVAGGISSQYFYRSMYAVQLHHCFKVRYRGCVVVYERPPSQLSTANW